MPGMDGVDPRCGATHREPPAAPAPRPPARAPAASVLLLRWVSLPALLALLAGAPARAQVPPLPPPPPPPQIAAGAVQPAAQADAARPEPAPGAGAAAAAATATGTAAAGAPAGAAGASTTRRRVAAAGGPPAHVTVVEDDGVRIEESRVRGQLTRVTVHSKVPGARPYDILVPPGGRDPAQERGVAGSSAWRLMSF